MSVSYLIRTQQLTRKALKRAQTSAKAARLPPCGFVRNAAVLEMQHLFQHLGHLLWNFTCESAENGPLAMIKEFFKKFLGPDGDPDHPTT